MLLYPTQKVTQKVAYILKECSSQDHKLGCFKCSSHLTIPRVCQVITAYCRKFIGRQAQVDSTGITSVPSLHAEVEMTFTEFICAQKTLQRSDVQLTHAWVSVNKLLSESSFGSWKGKTLYSYSKRLGRPWNPPSLVFGGY